MKIEFLKKWQEKQDGAYHKLAKDIAFDVLKQGSGNGQNLLPIDFVNEISKVNEECGFSPGC